MFHIRAAVSRFLFHLPCRTIRRIFRLTVPTAGRNFKCFSLQRIAVLTHHHNSSILHNRKNGGCAHTMGYKIPLCFVSIRKFHRIFVDIQNCSLVYQFSLQSFYMLYHISNLSFLSGHHPRIFFIVHSFFKFVTYPFHTFPV